jgi:hypothetical protein
MARASAQIPVGEYAKGFPPAVRTIMSAARATVKSIAPTAKQAAYRGWPTRYFDDDGPVVAVGGYTSYAAVFFFRATELEDHDKLLEGTGAKLRHVKLRAAADARRPVLKRLIRDAFRLGGLHGDAMGPGTGRRAS